MSKRHNWHSSHKGKEFEDRICEQLDELEIEYMREKIAHSKSTSKTNRGKFDLRILNPKIVMELKSRGTKSISYCLYADDPGNPNIKGHQLTALYKEYYTNGIEAGLLLEFRPHKAIYVPIMNFYKWACSATRKSITREIALNIGKEIDHIKELIE